MEFDSGNIKMGRRVARIIVIIMRELAMAVLYSWTFASLAFGALLSTVSEHDALMARSLIECLKIFVGALIPCLMIIGVDFGIVLIKTPTSMAVGCLLGVLCAYKLFCCFPWGVAMRMLNINDALSIIFIFFSLGSAVICAVGLARYINKERRAKRAHDAEAQARITDE